MAGDNGRDMTLKECRDYVNELAPKAPAAQLTKQFTNVDVPNTSRFLFSDPFEIMAKRYFQNTDIDFRESKTCTNL